MDDDITILGDRDVWGGSHAFGISRRDRRQHLYVTGRTGVGKSTLLLNLAASDIEAGHGVGFIDPHGDNAPVLLDSIPASRIEDVVFFNPSDTEFPIGLNLLRASKEKHLAVSGIVSAFKSIWREFWGPRLEYILTAALLALSECDNASILGVPRMLTDAYYRAWVIRQVEDPAVRSFWRNEFERYGTGFSQEAIAPIQNKAGHLLLSPILRNILGQVKNRLDARAIMDEGRIFIADLSKGKLGEDKTNLLGALLVAQFQLAAMSRSDMPEAERRDYFLIVDEFQSFATDSFASILSESRKYRLSLTLSHQYIDQVPKEIRHAVFGNVGSMVSFRVGERDAEILEREFGEGYSRAQLTGLGNHEICAKILHGGTYGEPLIGRTVPPRALRHGYAEAVIRRSRDKYATTRHVVERRIRQWLDESHH